MVSELKPCPECGANAVVVHMVDTYDRADFGFDAGCPRYKTNDGIHTKRQRVSGLPSKEAATEAWNGRVENGNG